MISYRLLSHVTNWEQLLSEMCRVAKTSVIVDYPEANSINYLMPWLFHLKKQIEKNTRPFRCFHDYELLESFESYGFALNERVPGIFSPNGIAPNHEDPQIFLTRWNEHSAEWA